MNFPLWNENRFVFNISKRDRERKRNKWFRWYSNWFVFFLCWTASIRPIKRFYIFSNACANAASVDMCSKIKQRIQKGYYFNWGKACPNEWYACYAKIETSHNTENQPQTRVHAYPFSLCKHLNVKSFSFLPFFCFKTQQQKQLLIYA